MLLRDKDYICPLRQWFTFWYNN